MTAARGRISVIVVDDHALVRDGLIRIVNAQPDMETVSYAVDGATAIERVRDLRPDLVVMDVRMPVLDGIEATRVITSERISPRTRILGLTTHDSDVYAIRMLQAGAVGFILKDSTAEQLVDALRAAHSGTFTTSASTAVRLVNRMAAGEAEGGPPDDSALAALTKRERVVFERVVSGKSNPEIARDLCVAEVTVKTHVGHILAKLHVRDRVQLVIWAHRRGLGAAELTLDSATSG
ncbi:DNA-binding NarL/FixJ family response regulator [Rathayibacter agropyri]